MYVADHSVYAIALLIVQREIWCYPGRGLVRDSSPRLPMAEQRQSNSKSRFRSTTQSTQNKNREEMDSEDQTWGVDIRRQAC